MGETTGCHRPCDTRVTFPGTLLASWGEPVSSENLHVRESSCYVSYSVKPQSEPPQPSLSEAVLLHYIIFLMCDCGFILDSTFKPPCYRIFFLYFFVFLQHKKCQTARFNTIYLSQNQSCATLSFFICLKIMMHLRTCFQ